MDKIIEAIIKVIPFAAAFGIWGISEDTSKGLSSVAVAVILFFVTDLLKKWQIKRKNKKTATDLKPYFTYQNVKQARDLFIPTQAQNNSPTLEDEAATSNRFIVKKELISWFLDTAFNEKKEDDKYYLLLAGSGMGKTTFMINLYVKYHSKYGNKRKIKLIPFRDNRIIDKLKELAKKQDEAKNTILLLDAFDEYKGLLPPDEPDGLTNDERFRKHLDEIVELTQDFREVVITSRTQYFPGQEDKPYELKIPRFDDKGYHTLAKLYLSPFDSKEIQKYLNKKYGILKFWNRNKKKIAQSIVKSSPKLMVRPMLLAYIDYLVDSNKPFETTYQIYDTLIIKWIEREAKKRENKSTNREKFINDLNVFSQKIALLIYENIKQNGKDSIDIVTATNLCNEENINIKDYVITGQSLLIRDIESNWKFAHKSILEFFLAKQAIENLDFFMEFARTNFAGMDMVKTFYGEVGDYIFVKGGTFKQENRNVTLSDYFIGKYQVTQKLWREVMGNNPSHFKACDDCPVEIINWYEAVEFCIKLSEKYNLSPYYSIDKNTKDPNNKNDIDKLKYSVAINKNARGIRLPTEAEWEFAARGGVKSQNYKYAGSNNVDEVAWYNKNSKEKIHPVGRKKANELGIYDMSGNVWEWCNDWYGGYQKKDVKNPQGAKSGSNRVDRGGGWSSDADLCRAANRYYDDADSRFSFMGFRIALSL